MNTMIKVGDTAEVIEVLKSEYSMLYNKKQFGVVVEEFLSENITAIVGKDRFDVRRTGWFIPKTSFRKVGRLTVTKVK